MIFFIYIKRLLIYLVRWLQGLSGDTFIFSCKKTYWSSVHILYFIEKNNLQAKFIILMVFFFTIF
jgi:hypothetical protein